MPDSLLYFQNLESGLLLVVMLTTHACARTSCPTEAWPALHGMASPKTFTCLKGRSYQYPSRDHQEILATIQGTAGNNNLHPGTIEM